MRMALRVGQNGFASRICAAGRSLETAAVQHHAKFARVYPVTLEAPR